MVTSTPDQRVGREVGAHSEGTGSGVLEFSGPQSSEWSPPGVPQDSQFSFNQVFEGPELSSMAPFTHSQRSLWS